MNMLKLKAGKFPTEVLNTETVADLVLSETYYKPGQMIENHSHRQAGFIIILHGEFVEIHEKRIRACKSSDVIFRPADQLHADHFERTSTRCLNMQFGSNWLSRLERITGDHLSGDPTYFSGGVIFQLGQKLYGEFRMIDLDSPLIMEGLALEMIGEANRLLIKEESGTPVWLKKVKERLHDHFPEPLSVQQLAIEAGVHPIYLHRAFRKHYNQSIGEYLRTLRMQFCCTQLASTNVPLADISAAAGFCDQGHFSRVFKRLCGMTPLAYRRFFRAV